MVELIVIIVVLGVGIALGMYIDSQVVAHIHRSTQDDRLLENMRNLQRPDIMDSIQDDLYKKDKVVLSKEEQARLQEDIEKGYYDGE
tara:strand:+ start:261 stop:521 length:261 start_codon:yes stop_codon:yes gene_type:complete